MIRKLPAELVGKIAAGEVVERPVSVVKELVENAIDAEATEVQIEVLNGGIDLIRISDNGVGMDKGDLELATQLHTTSKLVAIDDLEKILTYGFRGEALASISAVADVEIITAQTEAWNWKDEQITPSSRSRGTTISVKSLFRKVPARRKFLKSARAEEAQIRSFLKAVACANPNVAINYLVDDKEVFDYPASDFTKRCATALNVTSDKIFTGTQDANNSTIKLAVAHPTTASKRGQSIVIVNGRIIRSQLIAAAVKKGMGTKIPPELKPQFAVEIQTPGSEIDVNVHPRKEEIKFSEEKKIFSLVLHLTEDILNDNLRKEFEQRFGNSSGAGITDANDTGIDTNYSKNSNYTVINTPSADNKVSTSPPTSKSKEEYYPTPRERRSVEGAMSFSEKLMSPTNEYNPDQEFLQVFTTYIITTKDDRLIVIDQHAADERVKFDRLKQQYKQNGIETAPLLVSSQIDVELGERSANELIEAMAKIGFTIEEFGEGKSDGTTAFKVVEIPTLLLDKSGILGNLDKFFVEIQEIELDSIEAHVDRAIATIACHGSIRAGRRLTELECRKLISDLWDSSEPYTCPHGRPIVWELKQSELEKNFMRIK